MIGYIFLIGLSLSSLVTGDISLDPEAVCPLMVQGTNIMDANSCNTYYTCQGTSYTTYQCAGTLQYNKDTQKCVDASLGTCQGDANAACVNQKATTFVADPDSCSGYYYCHGDNTGSFGTCPNNWQFNKNTGECDYADRVKCTDKSDTTNPSLLCMVVPNNVYFGIREDCSKWARCKSDVYGTGECTIANQQFNTATGSCDYSSQCTQKQGSTSGDGEDTPTRIGEACAEPGAYISDGYSCAGFYWCSNQETLQWGSCKDGKYFYNGKCVSRYEAYCKYDRCVGTSLNWVADYSDCEYYYHCINGTESMKSYSCGDGKVFNEKNQTCATKSKGTASDPVCTKPSGTGGDDGNTGAEPEGEPENGSTGEDSDETGAGTGEDSDEDEAGTGE